MADEKNKKTLANRICALCTDSAISEEVHYLMLLFFLKRKEKDFCHSITSIDQMFINFKCYLIVKKPNNTGVFRKLVVFCKIISQV